MKIKQAIIWTIALVIGAVLGTLGSAGLNNFMDFIASAYTRAFQFVAVPTVALAILTAKMVAALKTGDLGKIAAALMNDLQPPAVRQHPEIADALVSLRTAGVIGAMMSGSGSSVFGLVADESEARRISSEMNARGYKAWPVQTL